MTRNTLLILGIFAAVCITVCVSVLVATKGPSMFYYILFAEKSRVFQGLEQCQWVSAEISYCVGDGPEVIQNTQVITDRDVLIKLRSLFAVRSWEFRTLHTASKWNKVIVTLDNGDKEALVLSPNEACYYAKNRNAAGIVLGSAFENYLREVLQKNEEENVHFYYGYPKGADISIKNQGAMLIPDDNKWRLDKSSDTER